MKRDFRSGERDGNSCVVGTLWMNIRCSSSMPWDRISKSRSANPFFYSFRSPCLFPAAPCPSPLPPPLWLKLAFRRILFFQPFSLICQLFFPIPTTSKTFNFIFNPLILFKSWTSLLQNLSILLLVLYVNFLMTFFLVDILFCSFFVFNVWMDLNLVLWLRFVIL